MGFIPPISSELHEHRKHERFAWILKIRQVSDMGLKCRFLDTYPRTVLSLLESNRHIIHNTYWHFLSNLLEDISWIFLIVILRVGKCRWYCLNFYRDCKSMWLIVKLSKPWLLEAKGLSCIHPVTWILTRVTWRQAQEFSKCWHNFKLTNSMLSLLR